MPLNRNNLIDLYRPSLFPRRSLALFDPFSSDFVNTSFDLADGIWDTARSTANQPGTKRKIDMDFVDKGAEYSLKADLPGVPKDQIDVKLEDNLLTISSERKDEADQETDGVVYKRRYYGKISQSMQLPKDVNKENISAKYQDGVLELTIPKLAQQQGERVKSIKVM